MTSDREREEWLKEMLALPEAEQRDFVLGTREKLRGIVADSDIGRTIVRHVLRKIVIRTDESADGVRPWPRFRIAELAMQKLLEVDHRIGASAT